MEKKYDKPETIVIDCISKGYVMQIGIEGSGNEQVGKSASIVWEDDNSSNSNSTNWDEED